MKYFKHLSRRTFVKLSAKASAAAGYMSALAGGVLAACDSEKDDDLGGGDGTGGKTDDNGYGYGYDDGYGYGYDDGYGYGYDETCGYGYGYGYDGGYGYGYGDDC
jgi:hypothetical protein